MQLLLLPNPAFLASLQMSSLRTHHAKLPAHKFLDHSLFWGNPTKDISLSFPSVANQEAISSSYKMVDLPSAWVSHSSPLSI